MLRSSPSRPTGDVLSIPFAVITIDAGAFICKGDVVNVNLVHEIEDTIKAASPIYIAELQLDSANRVGRAEVGHLFDMCRNDIIDSICRHINGKE